MALAYDDGVFTDDLSPFSLWDDGQFGEDVFSFSLVDAGYWTAYLVLDGIDFSAADSILSLVLSIPITPLTTLALQDVQSTLRRCIATLQLLALPVMPSIDPAIIALAVISRIILVTQQVMNLGADTSTVRNLDIQAALLSRAYVLLRRTIAGIQSN